MNHETHTDSEYVPVFEPPVDPDINQTLVEEVCGTNQFCIFDFQTTGSQTFAQATADSVNEYEEAVESRAIGGTLPQGALVLSGGGGGGRSVL